MNYRQVQKILSFLPSLEQFPGSGDTMLFRARLADDAAKQKLNERLTANGYLPVSNLCTEGTVFTILQNEEQTLYLAVREDGEARVVATSERWSPTDSAWEKVADPLVTQMRGLYCVADCGMTYVIRLSDGRFVLIDSGLGEYEEVPHLLSVLEGQNVLGGKPVVAAWFFTHRHGDHFRGFEEFYEQFSDRIRLERLIYQWPLAEWTGGCSPSDRFDAIAASLPEGSVITPHAGQRFRFADAVFDVLLTAEDLYPAFIRNFNDTSTVLRMTLGNHRVMWLGDAQRQASDLLCERFTRGDLAADVLQVAHHGYWGGSVELYTRIDPEILLWPCPDFWYHEARGWGENQPLVNSRKVREIYLAGNEETVLPFASDDLTGHHRLPAFPAPVIWHEDFSGDSVGRLYWACISGGSTGYAPPALDMSRPGEIRITAGATRGVCTLLRQGLLDLPEGFTVTLTGKTGASVGRMGLIWNDPRPTVPDDAKVLWLDPAAGEEFRFRLEADAPGGIARLYRDGDLLQEIPYVPQKNCGLHLVLEDTELFLRDFLAVAGTARESCPA